MGQGRKVLCHVLEYSQEKPICLLQYIGLMDCGDLLSPQFQGSLKGIPYDLFTGPAGDEPYAFRSILYSLREILSALVPKKGQKVLFSIPLEMSALAPHLRR